MENFYFFSSLVIRANSKAVLYKYSRKAGPNLNKQQVKMKVNFYENATYA